MELRYIQEFVTLAETQKFSAAARKLHISQSTLSRHIQTMEAELGCPLFVRTTREMELSALGEIYLPYARKLAQTAKAADAALKGYEKQQKQTVRVGVVRNPDRYKIMDCLTGFRRAEPQFTLSVLEGTISELTEAFAGEKLNLITTAYVSWEQPTERFVPVGESRLCALLPATHPLAAQKVLSLSSLQNEHLILPEPNNVLFQYLYDVLKREEIFPNVVYQGSSSGAFLQMRSGQGIMIQDQAAAAEHMGDDVILKALEPEISYIFGLTYGSRLSPGEQAFVHYVKQRFPTLQPDSI